MASKRGSRSAEVSALGVKSVKRLCATVDKASLVLYNYDNLVPAVLLTRYKRFLGNVVLETSGKCMEAGPHTVIHVPNTGPMTGLLDGLPTPVLLSKSNVATRKYPHTLEWMKPNGNSGWVGVHSAKANAMVRSLLEARAIPQLMPYDALRSEVKYGSENSRIDFLLEECWEGEASKSKYHYVEVKSVTLAEDVDSTVWVIIFCSICLFIRVDFSGKLFCFSGSADRVISGHSVHKGPTSFTGIDGNCSKGHLQGVGGLFSSARRLFCVCTLLGKRSDVFQSPHNSSCRRSNGGGHSMRAGCRVEKSDL